MFMPGCSEELPARSQDFYVQVSPNPEGMLFRVRVYLCAFWRRNLTNVTRKFQSSVNRPLARKNSVERFLFLRALRPAMALTKFSELTKTFTKHAWRNVTRIWRGTQVVREEPAKLLSWVRFPSAPPFFIRAGSRVVLLFRRGRRQSSSARRGESRSDVHCVFSDRNLVSVHDPSHPFRRFPYP